MTMDRTLGQRLADRTRRAVDIGVAAMAFVVLAPVLALLAAVVYVFIGAPVIFRQQRAGLHGERFTLYKFRTMTDMRGRDGRLLPDRERLPAVGAWIRSTSLDELPQIWNVLKGEMSLVGPRPLPPEYNELYTVRQAERLQVRPGLTGWTAVNGRSALDWERKFELDVWYVEHRSLRLDLRILLRTVIKVIRREGISHQGEVNSPPFTGSTGPDRLPAMEDCER